MIEPGTYKATVLKHGISETKDGSLQAVVTFSLDAGGPKTLAWFGSFKEKALPHTIKALLVCGLKGNSPAGPLDIGREVSIVVDEEIGQDGKTRTKVRWVNAIGGAIKNVVDQNIATAKLAALEGAVMAARHDLKIPESASEDMPAWMKE